jgi:hypothetical protein
MGENICVKAKRRGKSKKKRLKKKKKNEGKHMCERLVKRKKWRSCGGENIPHVKEKRKGKSKEKRLKRKKRRMEDRKELKKRTKSWRTKQSRVQRVRIFKRNNHVRNFNAGILFSFRKNVCRSCANCRTQKRP